MDISSGISLRLFNLSAQVAYLNNGVQYRKFGVPYVNDDVTDVYFVVPNRTDEVQDVNVEVMDV